MTLGDKIRAARMALGLSQKDLAERIGVEPPSVSRWESNKFGVDAEHIPKLSKILNKPADWFAGVEPEIKEVMSRLTALESKSAEPLALSPVEQELLRNFRGCHPVVQEVVFDKAKQGFIANRGSGHSEG